MAFDQRFAVVLVGSSGEGGAKLHRRNWGEAVENLTGSGEYHWMAGNFLKYGAAESTFGSKNAGDLPVDAHELIALCAPRLTFISYGVPEKGDAKWLDHQGSYMAAVAAQPVFRLLGAKDLGASDDYKTEKMPAVNVGLLDGQLAWRQHDGGHTDGPNWKYFIPWADKFLKRRHARRLPVAIRRLAARAGARASTAAAGCRLQAGRSDRRAAHRSELDRSRTRSCSRRRSAGHASTSTSSATRSRGAGARPTIPSCSRTGSRTSSAGTRPTSAGAPTGSRTSCGASRTASSTASTRRSSCILAGTNNVGTQPGGDEQGRRHHARAQRASSTSAAARRRARRSS